ncbi:MAG: outer membrane beta-barrel protein [Methylococcales bacterium]
MGIYRWQLSGCNFWLAVLCASMLANLVEANEVDDFDRPGLYAGIGGTYAFHWFAGKSFDRNLGGGNVQVVSSSSGGANARLGYRVNDWFAAEAEYEWIDGFTNKIRGNNVATLTSHQLTLNGKFLYSDWGRIQPYGLLGVGVSIWTARDRNNQGAGLDKVSAGLAGRVGLGVDAYATENLLVNLEVDMALSTTTINNSRGGNLKNLFYIPIQLGIQYRF